MSDVAQKIDWPAESSSGEVSSRHHGFPTAGSTQQRANHVGSSRSKRLMDIWGAGLGLLILLPFLALVALAVALESRGPIIFRQRRSGHDGRIFMIYKFRTMSVMEDGADVTQATRGDERVTRVGKFLRRSSIDELPQLVNVLKGEMSLVGPRPHAVAHDQYYGREVPNYHLRFQAKPGITGRAQVAGLRGEVRDLAQMQARVGCDLEYIENWSLTLDARILFLTVTTAPFQPSAY
jgi:putative colanic acid biosysnthesis UDP-glucose lipid carrier transferase